MASISDIRLQQVIDRFEEVEARMGATSDTSEIIALSKEHAELKPVVEKAKELLNSRSGLKEAQSLAAGSDKEMAELAEMEIDELKEKLPALEQEMQILLLPKDVDDTADIVLEIRAGTGGDEAAIFAGDLFRMYSRYAQLMGWKVDVVDASPGDAGGYKEIVANVSGDGVFGHMKWESGVHRVQRVPATETQGRIHTSAATVAVLPAPDRDRGQAGRHPYRYNALLRGGRPARQHDRLRSAHHPPCDRHHGDELREVTACEPREGDGAAEDPPLRKAAGRS